MIIGKNPLNCTPTWSLDIVNSLDLLGVTFNCNNNPTTHVNNRISKCRQSFYGLNSSGLAFPGANCSVKSYLWNTVCVPTLLYGMETIPLSSSLTYKVESTQATYVKQSLGLSKSSHSTSILRALNVSKVCDILYKSVWSLYNRNFKVDSPVAELNKYFLMQYTPWGTPR